MTDGFGGAQTGTSEPRSDPRRATGRAALPLGTIGVLAGCLLSWRDALKAGVFDDAFWHRAVGVWMLDHHRVLTHDTLSYTVHGRSWITPEWGYGVLLAGSVRLVGPVAFWLLSAGIASLAVICVAARCRMAGAGWLWTGLLSAEAGGAIALFLDDRPQVLSYLFVALLLLLLTWARRRPAVVWAVPVLFVLWANTHGSFLLGIAIIVLDVAFGARPLQWGRLRSGPPLAPRSTVVALGGAVIGTLVNPFGPKVYGAALGVTFNSSVRRFVTEWQSPDFHNPSTFVLVVLPVAVTVLSLAVSDRPVAMADLVLAGGLLVATLDAFRFLPYFAIAWCGLAARSTPLAEEQLRPTLLVWPLGAVLALSMLQGPWVPAGRPAAGLPVEAVGYLRQHPGRVFSSYLWNDYLDWEGIPVFIDGRTELYTGTPVLGQYLALDAASGDPDRVLRSYDVRYVLWAPGTALAGFLARDPHWTVVRRSASSVLFRAGGP